MTELHSPVVVLGARSDIGRAIARRYAEAGCALVLGARGAHSLESDAADLRTRYRVPVSVVEFDLDVSAPDAFFSALAEPPGTLIMVAGLLGDQAVSEEQDAEAARVMHANYTGPGRFVLAAARAMQRRGGGCIVGVSSVAGDRGRASNFVYGSAKAGFTALLSGLRNRHARGNIHVITVKPGFVATRMTAHLDLPRALTVDPDTVARKVVAAHRKKHDVIYVGAIWRSIMWVIRAIPERIFKRLSI